MIRKFTFHPRTSSKFNYGLNLFNSRLIYLVILKLSLSISVQPILDISMLIPDTNTIKNNGISMITAWLGTNAKVLVLSKSKLNHISTQPQFNITLVGLDMKMTLHTPPHPQKPNVSNISAVTNPILMKL